MPEGEPPEVLKAKKEGSLRFIAGVYLLIESLGRGAFGEVFLAENIKYNPPRRVAIKLLHRQFLNDPQVREDIVREASALARFNHPNILPVIDFEVTPEQAFIVTTLAEGGSLSDKIRPDRSKPPVRMPLPEVASYLDQIAEGLDEAHSQGLIHRDLKPLNILLNKKGQPLLADFGLAAALSSSASSVLVDTGASGTPLYMAPEQWGGFAGKASDIYSLGVLVYQLITGSPPFMGNEIAVRAQHLFNPPPSLREKAPDLEYPPELDLVIAGALNKDPKLRTKPALEFARQFRAALNNSSKEVPTVILNPPSPIQTVPVNFSTRPAALASNQTISAPVPVTLPAPGPVKRSNLPLVAILGVSLVVLLVGIIFLLGNNSNNGAPTAVGTNAAVTLVPQSISTPEGSNLSQAVSPVGFITTVPSSPGIQPTAVKNFAFGEAITSFQASNSPLYSLAFSPDGKYLATGGTDNIIHLYAINSRTQYTLISHLRDHTGAVTSLAFSPDSKTLASASLDKTVKLWEIPAGRMAFTATGHTDAVTSVAFSSDGKTLASGGGEGVIWLRNTTTLDRGRVLQPGAPVFSLAFSPDGKILASGGRDKNIKLWEVATNKDLVTLTGHNGTINSLAFTPDSRFLSSGSDDKIVKVWSISPYPEGGVPTVKEVSNLSSGGAEVYSVFFGVGGKYLAAGYGDALVKVWEAPSKEVANLKGQTKNISGVAFSPDGKTLGTASYDGTIKLWNFSNQ